MRSLVPFIPLVLACILPFTHAAKESFDEELVIKPLKDGKLFTHFQFTTRLNYEPTGDALFSHYGLFPKAIGQIIQQYGARELHLTFTQGRWNYENWGYPIAQSAGTGVELWAWMYRTENLESNWKALTNALSGLFCASLNFIDETITSRPRMSFRPEGFYNEYADTMHERYDGLEDDSELRYGSLPHESVCTENLTPWIKLLPCKAKAGASTLLNAHKLYDTNFHSMAIHIRPICMDANCDRKQLELVQTVTSVFDPVRVTARRDWSLQSLFDRKIEKSCAVASHSRVLVMLPAAEEGVTWHIIPSTNETMMLKVGEDTRQIAVYDLAKVEGPFDLQMIWQENAFPFPLKPSYPLFFAHRYFTGYGQERGGLTVNIVNQSPNDTMPVIYFDSIPWYLKLYLHTLKVSVVGREDEKQDDLVLQTYYQPAIDRSRPSILEMRLSLPPNSITTVSIEFDKVFLKYTEHRPDANRGFDVGSAVLTTWIPNGGADLIAPGNLEHALAYNDGNGSIFGSLQPIRIYTETLLVSLPTPDFSMPYNVITLTCTVIALFFGSMFNLLTRSFVILQEEEKKAEGKSGKVKGGDAHDLVRPDVGPKEGSYN
ncbi:GPI transamidase component PIG-T [Endogone sp. FLAS-F59071]|nr:GPI transamidase component PIG-T [Endogone sp. FLAS-F59071]|eukprot:RUS16083.1 GPI transamidase component PIG-T [Endogone sp. FLAS-F59071]